MGTYRQPMMLQPLDFSRVSSKLSDAGKSIVDSFNQRQALRLARAEEFKSDYKKYAEKVILDNNEYLADETREIMQENLLNIDNFAAMSEGDRLKTMSSVQSFNNSNKIASRLINELGAMELDARSWDDPVVQITQAYVSGNFEDVKRIPHTNGKIGADFEVSLRDENGELTGEKRLVTQNEFIARGNNILTTSPESDIETVNTTVSDLIQQHQKNLDDFSSRGGTYDPTNKVRQYFETMDEEILDTYYGNVFRKGDDYLEIPDTDASGNKLTDEDKQAIFETKREELINHLTGRVINELIKKPYPKASATTTGGSGKSDSTKTESIGEVIPLGNASKLNKDNPEQLEVAVGKLATRLMAGAGARDAAGRIPEDLRKKITDAVLKAQEEGNSALAFKGDVIEIDDKKYNIQDAFFTVNPGSGELQLHWDSYPGLTPEQAETTVKPSAY